MTPLLDAVAERIGQSRRVDLVDTTIDAVLSSGQECFVVFCLNARNRLLGWQMISLGTATACLCHPREVFRAAIVAAATGVLCAHNHPSGDPAPSSADLNITRQLREASKVLGISLVDHVVIGRPEADPCGRGYYSFREAGII